MKDTRKVTIKANPSKALVLVVNFIIRCYSKLVSTSLSYYSRLILIYKCFASVTIQIVNISGFSFGLKLGLSKKSPIYKGVKNH